MPYKIKTFGSSMLPLLHDQDIIYLKKIKFPNIKVNDVICVRKNGKTFTHRVIYKHEVFASSALGSQAKPRTASSAYKAKNYLITKGDTNTLSDGKVYPGQIVGKVEKVKRNGEIFDIESLYLLQSTLYFQEIVKIKKAFEKKNIKYVFLKGLPLHLHYEGSHPRRIYSDCDILIQRTDFKKAEKIFKRFGYKSEAGTLSGRLEKIRAYKAEISFLKVINNFLIVFDIHFEAVFVTTYGGNFRAFYPQVLINSLTDDFLREKQIIKTQGENFPILSLDNLFIYLALHIFHHNYKSSYRYEFLANVLRILNVNYEEVTNKIIKYKVQNFIYPCLILLNKHYKSDFPQFFLESIKPPYAVLRFIDRNILSLDIFSDEGRNPKNRFKYLFFLSPLPYYKKMSVFLNPWVAYSTFWIAQRIVINIIKMLKLRLRYYFSFS